MTRVLGVSLDFYGTLVEIDEDVPTIAEALTRMGFPCSADLETIWNSSGFDGHVTHDGGQEAYMRWRSSALRSLALLCGVAEGDADRVADDLIALDRRWTVKARSGAIALVQSLRVGGVPHCVLTNWDYPLAPYLEMAGLPADLPSLTSAEVGARKPHRAAFEAARNLMGVPPERHIHVGDSWSADVAGAVRAGAWALWVADGQGVEPLPSRIAKCCLAEVPAHVSRIADLVAI